ncbi:CgeB family protein [Rhizorhapis suberifaciens]|uniref:Spore maturation protein CgeB n=1 Tax=Rhizorhapis suberifaciens TaxID=13656 RepID=A0A840HWE7_9SPHN|nr:glycosyltransferase [Rhizorhapis suberifaciens]MBB4641900.1 spore maturation protein CgeB [Rhizorhapis suberifaciens]
MKIVYFTHSLLSCWNHGNAHFQRGVLRELQALGHEVKVMEPQDSWSLSNLLTDHGEQGLSAFHEAYPELTSNRYERSEFDAERAVDQADLVIVHEWTDAEVVAALGKLRKKRSGLTLLFHDTHHRMVSDPEAIRTFDLSGFDGVLAFGGTLAEMYRKAGWGRRTWVWHEAADLRLFKPPQMETDRQAVAWIGNWGDDERGDELREYLLVPCRSSGLALDIWGVRYPAHALATLRLLGAHYHGWVANARTPALFARAMATVHVPRRFYTTLLPGIPTIRVFEALACGVPLVCAPWEDSEGLFRPGEDYLVARDPGQMRRYLTALRDDPQLRAELAANGLQQVRSRHGCSHRAAELLDIHAQLTSSTHQEQAA